jgi:hypothetical protein
MLELAAVIQMWLTEPAPSISASVTIAPGATCSLSSLPPERSQLDTLLRRRLLRRGRSRRLLPKSA